MFVLPSFHAGGTENYAWRFIKYYKKNDFHSSVKWFVWSVLNEKGDLETNFLNEGCITITKSIGYVNPISMLKFYLWLRKNKIEVVVNFNGNFGGISMLIASLARIDKRIVWYRRSTNAFQSTMLRNLYNDLSKYLVNKFSTHILSNSFAAIDFFFGKNKLGVDKRYSIIPNGINAKEYLFSGTKLEARSKLGITTNKFVIGHVGRFDPSKNHETLFKVIQLLKAQKADCMFLFCGKDTDSEEFRSKLEEYKITDVVISIGLSNRLNMVYKALDLFVFPSVTEGQPNALLEALTAGTPFFASDISTIKELIPEFSYKFLFSPKDVDQITGLILDELSGKINRSDTLELTNTMIDLYNQEKHYSRFISIINE